MPIAKIFYSPKVQLKSDRFAKLAEEVESLLLQGFKAAPGITGEVLFIPTAYIHFGKDLYIEVECRQEAYYIPEKLNQLSADLEKLVKNRLDVESACKVRLLAFDNTHIYWFD